MSLDARMRFLRTRILDWWKMNKRQFDWRRSDISTYKLLVSEILLKRTQATRVQHHLRAFFSKYPNWATLTEAKIEDVEATLYPLGLQRQRSRGLISLALKIMESGGKVPRKRSELEELPGIGSYIASAVLLLCHGKTEPLLDSNMARVLERYFGYRRKSDIRIDTDLKNLARILISHRLCKELNWAILDFAAILCRPQKPKCHNCPVNPNCFWYRERLEQDDPRTRKH